MSSSISEQISFSANLSEEKLRYWIALSLIPAITVRRLHKLIAFFKSPDNLFTTSSSSMLASCSLHPLSLAFIKQPDWKAVDDCMTWLNQDYRRSLMTWSDPDYPPLLREIPDPP